MNPRMLLFALSLPLAAAVAAQTPPPAAAGKPAAAASSSASSSSPAAAAAPAKPAALEPLCLAIEPSVLRTALARPLPGSRLTVVAPAREHELGLKLLTEEEYKALGLTWQEFEQRAVAAAERLLKTLKPDMRKSADGKSTYGVIRSDSHLTPGILFAPSLPELFHDTLGDRLVVLMPDRFTLYIFPRGFPDFQKLGRQVVGEFNAAVWPCSLEAFEVSSEGVKCIGSFDNGEGSGASPDRKSEKPRPESDRKSEKQP